MATNNNKPTLAVDKTVENKETEKGTEAAKEAQVAKEKADKAEAKQVAAMAGTPVEGGVAAQFVKENDEELRKAVEADAKKRKKNFEVCPISGVFVVN